MSDSERGDGGGQSSTTDPGVGPKSRWMSGKPKLENEAPAGSQDVHFKFFGKTDVGLVREHNEDNLMVADLDSDSGPLPTDEERSGVVSSRGLVLAVCDGMGGAAAGEVASQMAVDILHEKLRGDEAPADRDDFAYRLVTAVQDAGSRIFQSAKKDRSRRGMGTTATVAGLIDQVLFVGQVGDSRCYVLRNGRLSLITKDQSLVNQLIEAGQLTEAEAEAFEHSNIILQALGTTEKVVVDLTFVELRRGDRVLLCSDGLCGLVHDEVIQEEMACIGSLPHLAERLIELANAAGGHDNVTCIVADFDGEALSLPDESVVPFYQQYPLPLDGNRDSGGAPANRPVIKSIVPRPMPAVREAIRRVSEPPDDRPLSWSRAVTTLFIGLAAVVIVVSASKPRGAQQGAEAPVLPAPYVEHAQTGIVQVHSALDPGDLHVNGQNYGPVNGDSPVLLELVPGAHSLEIRGPLGELLAAMPVAVEANMRSDVTLRASNLGGDRPASDKSAPPE